MKTLIYSDLYPLPENIGTRMRTMNFVRFFNRIGEVDLAYRRTGEEHHAVRGLFRKEYRIGNSNVPEESGNGSCYGGFRDRIRRLADRRPWIVADWPKSAIEELNAVVAGDRYDFVLCRYMQDSHPFLRFQDSLRKRVIIDFDDVFSTSLFDAYVRRAPGFYAGLKWHLQRRMLSDYQRRCLRLGAAIFCSEEDRKEVTGNSGFAKAHIVPNTYPITARFRTPDGSGYVNRRTLLFVGALDYGPNIAGLKWFIQSVLPPLREAYRDIRLLIAGRRPPESLVQACIECPGVELHPDVPDIGPFYEKCGAVVVPLLSGGGTRIKILEAAMAGRPVFSTPIGAHGLSSDAGLHLNLFTDDGSFMDRYRNMDDEKRYRDCIMNMHAAVQNTYSPEAFDRSMEKVVDSLLGEAMGGVFSGSIADGRSAR